MILGLKIKAAGATVAENANQNKAKLFGIKSSGDKAVKKSKQLDVLNVLAKRLYPKLHLEFKSNLHQKICLSADIICIKPVSSKWSELDHLRPGLLISRVEKTIDEMITTLEYLKTE
jgi:hypothetical protein